ncbi:DNA-3-methyladenine glycosylase family protein [Anabaena subtropica]|uniref:DNA-3-methyladenine glycosylase II n=1 Tax=Anabaena subtropica FACHB-260 TaxID=2692884 RepID=A0ABR8CKF2_9NOST|nr:DNA-3-methyladenine glycosylase 2 family protein [Anabaena subtropica]MBD2342779.1 DNA-3-methyladenine glycosylase 2 family protein [Anabaena subtropica FACHB-260]
MNPRFIQISELELLTPVSFNHALIVLANLDSDLARVLETLGTPPLWKREAGFPTLVQIILEQQVSLAAAKAVFNRLLEIVKPLTPENFLQFDDEQFRLIGFSRQKSLYCRGLANAIVSNQLDLTKLPTMDENAIRTQLKRIKGIGDWTVDIYLLMALQHRDAFPKGDLGLLIAAQQVKGLATRPTPVQLEAIAQNWRPWRAVAARILWHYYLNNHGKAVTVYQ